MAKHGTSTVQKGRLGEDEAVAFLQSRGWTVLSRNWRCRGAELDIVAERGHELAFVEVRSRLNRSEAQERPEESVTFRKRQRLERAAAAWMAVHDCSERLLRFDVLGVDLRLDSDGGTCVVEIRHHESAFEAQSLF